MRRPDRSHPLAAHYQRAGGPWDGPTLDVLLSSAAAVADPTTALVVDDADRLTSIEVERAVAAVAGGLAARGVGAGDAVAWQVENGAAALVLYRACWRLGAVAVPVHHLAAAAEVADVLARVEPTVVLAEVGRPAADAVGVVRLADATAGALRAEVAGPTRPAGVIDVAAHDVAVLLFTSGSTGRAKGVLHTHRTLVAKATAMVHAHGLGRHDAVLMPAPLAHVSGLLNGVLVPAAVPMRTVLMARWDPARALRRIIDEQVSFMVGPPTFFHGLLAADGCTPDAVRSLRLVSCGGAGVSEAFAADAAAGLGAVVKRTYGSTEAPTITTSTPEDPPAAGWATDGRPVGDAEVRIGEGGEVQVRGPEVFAGYLDHGDEVGVLDADGWFRTGDLGSIDADGRLVITGRLHDVIIRGGENVAAAEVEAVLEAHPSVRQAVVVGEPDARLGERVAAFVVGDESFDVAVCRSWFAERGVARFKVPERVEVLDALPLLASAKPDRRALAARLQA